MPLTKRKRLYADARLAGMGMKKAAIAAGCPDRTAQQAASRYEKDADVLAAMGRSVSAGGVKVAEPESKRHNVRAPTPDPDPYIPSDASGALEFLKGVMNDLEADPKLRIDAAKALASYTVAKPGPHSKGKKEMTQDKAEDAFKRFQPAGRPRLIVNNG